MDRIKGKGKRQKAKGKGKRQSKQMNTDKQMKGKSKPSGSRLKPCRDDGTIKNDKQNQQQHLWIAATNHAAMTATTQAKGKNHWIAAQHLLFDSCECRYRPSCFLLP